jgi:hypothetical protein
MIRYSYMLNPSVVHRGGFLSIAELVPILGKPLVF